MYIKKTCENFVYQNDRNGEFAIGCCIKMIGDKDHEGNYGRYPCPIGLQEKRCYQMPSRKSDDIDFITITRLRELFDNGAKVNAEGDIETKETEIVTMKMEKFLRGYQIQDEIKALMREIGNINHVANRISLQGKDREKIVAFLRSLYEEKIATLEKEFAEL